MSSAPARTTPLDELLKVPLPRVEVGLGRATGLDPLRCAEVTIELKRWLWLCNRYRSDVTNGHSGHPVPPTLPIFQCQQLLDEAWHAFILDTPAYHDFCSEHLGGYVHHVPEMHDGASCLAGGPHSHRHFDHDDVTEVLEYITRVFGPRTLWDWYVRDGLAANGADVGDLSRDDAEALVAGLSQLLL